MTASSLSTERLELQVCGQALWYNDLVRDRRSQLAQHHFGRADLGLLWKEIVRRVENGEGAKPDFLEGWCSVTECFDVPKLWDLVKGARDLTDADFEAAEAEIIRCAGRRSVRQLLADAAAHDAENVEADGAAILSTVLNILQQGGADLDCDDGAWKRLGDVARAAVEAAKAGQSMGISTGFNALDELTNGGKPGKLWTLGAATSMGKSIVGQSFALSVAKAKLENGDKRFGVACVHLEMDEEEVGLRAATGEAFEPERMPKGYDDSNPHYLSAARNDLSGGQWDRIADAINRIDGMHFYIDDRPGRTLSQIEAALSRLFRKMRRQGVTPGLVVIDHEGLIAPEEKRPSELEYARARAAGLKNMAKRLGVWIVALSQITKEAAKLDGEDYLPTSQDLNYGSALSQASSTVLLLHRKAYYAQRKPEDRKTTDDKRAANSREGVLIVDKARGGRRGKVKVLIDVAAAAMIEDRS